MGLLKSGIDVKKYADLSLVDEAREAAALNPRRASAPRLEHAGDRGAGDIPP